MLLHPYIDMLEEHRPMSLCNKEFYSIVWCLLTTFQSLCVFPFAPHLGKLIRKARYSPLDSFAGSSHAGFYPHADRNPLPWPLHLLTIKISSQSPVPLFQTIFFMFLGSILLYPESFILWVINLSISSASISDPNFGWG